MELCVNHKFTTNPSADDIAQAIDATPHPDDWYLVLDADDGSYIDAAARPTAHTASPRPMERAICRSTRRSRRTG